MPVPVECEYCFTSFQVPDEALGKRVKCKNCGERITVSPLRVPSEAPRPQRARKQSAPASSAPGMGVMIGVIVGAVVALLGVGAFFMMGSSDDGAPSASSVTGTTPASTGDPSQGEPASGAGTTNTSTTTPSSGGGFQKPETSVKEGTAPTAEKDTTQFALSANWSVDPDPPQGESTHSVEKPLAVELDPNNLRSAGVVFPEVPSSFVAVQESEGAKYWYDIYNVVSGKQIAEAQSPSFITCTALSEDGSYLAVASAGGTKIDVWDVEAKQSLGTLDPKGSGSKGVSHLALFGKKKLIGISQLDRAVRIWELPSGNLVREIQGGEKFNPNYGYAFSPGGRYFAVIANFLTKQIDVYDLESGQVKGSIVFDGERVTFSLGAIGFSRDGGQLAAVYEMPEHSRMVVWDLHSDKAITDFTLEPSLKEQLDPVYQSVLLESFPGNQYWLVNSLGVVDINAKQLIYGYPKQDKVGMHPSRKVIGMEHVLSVSSDGRDARLEVLTLSKDQLLAGTRSAESGGLPSDVNLPPLTAADYRNASPGVENKEWSAEPGSLDVDEIKERISFPSEGTLRDIALSRSAKPLIAVRAGINEDLDDQALTVYQKLISNPETAKYDYKPVEPVAEETEAIAFHADGTEAARFRFPFSSKLLDISPDGTKTLFEEHRTNGRLDVFQVSDEGMHLLGWRPYRVETNKDHREIRMARFIDDDHIATLSRNQVLVVWNIQELKPVWKREEVQQFALTPQGKYLVVVQGNSIRSKSLDVFESLTGAGKGSIELDGKVHSMSMHPNGQWLALTLIAGPNHVLSTLALKTGEFVEEFPIPVAGKELAWVGDDYLLMDGSKLISRPMQAVVWNYERGETVIPPAQVSHQFCVGRPGSGARSSIHAMRLPDSRVVTKLNPDKLKQLALLSPGSAVNAQANVAADPLLEPLKLKALELLTKQLEASQKSVGPQGDAQVSALFTLESLGSTEVSKIGNRDEKTTVTRKAVSIKVTYQQQGRTIWESIRKVGNLDRILVRIPPGKAIQEAIDEQMVERAEQTLAELKLPTFVFGENANDGLGTSNLIQ